VTRLTDPAHASGLPPRTADALPRNGAFLLYSSDRTGKPQAYRMDLKTGESDQLTQAEALLGETLRLTPDGRSLCYFDGPWLYLASLANVRARRVYAVGQGWELARGFSISSDGRRAAFVESRGPTFRLRLLAMQTSSVSTVLEAEAPLRDPLIRPSTAGILYRRGEEGLWLAGYDGRQNRQLKLAPGRAGPACWSRDGRAVFYLSYPEDRRALNTIREHTPEKGDDQLISPTSQFVAIGPNSDASVFVGASANKASPHVLLVTRSTRREFTLCEHRASDASAVAPIFSPDSQQVFFRSDTHGKPAIYRMRVDRLVERTET
jgi:oligogalacturonide lyase